MGHLYVQPLRSTAPGTPRSRRRRASGQRPPRSTGWGRALGLAAVAPLADQPAVAAASSAALPTESSAAVAEVVEGVCARAGGGPGSRPPAAWTAPPGSGP